MHSALQQRAILGHRSPSSVRTPHVFDIYFYFKMRFAPQCRAMFQHLKLQKWSEPGVFF